MADSRRPALGGVDGREVVAVFADEARWLRRARQHLTHPGRAVGVS
jgi:hypothetical protein